MKLSFMNQLQSNGSFTAFKIAAIYLLVGGLWILFSDRLLMVLANDPAILTRLQTFNGENAAPPDWRGR